MSARDLAIGLLLGDGGGGGYYDKTFHEILNHTEIFLERALDSAYTVKFGIWTQQGFAGNLEAGTNRSDVFELFGYNNTGNSPKLCGLLEYQRCNITPVYIVYKNNAPIYAVPDPRTTVKLSPDFSSIQYGYGNNKYKYAFFVSRDYRLESLTLLGGGLTISTEQVRFDGIDYTVPSRFFEATCGLSMTYSYQNYNGMDSGTEHPYVVKSGNRVTQTTTIALYSGSGSGIVGTNYDYQNTVFTDLSNEELYREFQNVYNAEFTALGFDTYPVEILSPST